MDDSVSVALERGPYGMELFGALPPLGVGAQTGLCVEGLLLKPLYPFPYRHLFFHYISRSRRRSSTLFIRSKETQTGSSSRHNQRER